jgi:hypothetical protein
VALAARLGGYFRSCATSLPTPPMVISGWAMNEQPVYCHTCPGRIPYLPYLPCLPPCTVTIMTINPSKQVIIQRIYHIPVVHCIHGAAAAIGSRLSSQWKGCYQCTAILAGLNAPRGCTVHRTTYVHMYIGTNRHTYIAYMHIILSGTVHNLYDQ